MQLQAESYSLNGEPWISVSVPPTRSDILHARDLVEVINLQFSSYSMKCQLNFNHRRITFWFIFLF
jgi:hypothetical protein